MIAFAQENGKKKTAVCRLDGKRPEACRDEGEILYRKYAAKKEAVVMVCGNDEELCHLALGLELASYRFDKYLALSAEDYEVLEKVTFVTPDPIGMIEKYKPYMAIGNAVRYTRDLFNEPEEKFDTEEFFYEVKRLEYLGLLFESESHRRFSLQWLGSDLIIMAKNRKESSVAAGLLKLLALQKADFKVRAEMELENNREKVNDLLREKTIYIGEELKNDKEAGDELLRLYKEIKRGRNNGKR